MKHSLLILTFLVLGILFLSCSDKKDREVEPRMGMFIEQHVLIKIKNPDGADLLNPSSPNSLKRFKVYYLVDGEKKLYHEPWFDAPGAYLIRKWDGDDYVLQVFLNGPTLQRPNTSGIVTLLEFEDGHTDTITADYDVRPNYLAVTKAYYNDKLEWDTSTNNGNMGILQLTMR